MNAVRASLDHSVIFKVIYNFRHIASNNEVFDIILVILKSTVALGSSIGDTIGGVIGAIIFIIILTLFVVLAVVFAMKWRKDKWLGTRSQGTSYSM